MDSCEVLEDGVLTDTSWGIERSSVSGCDEMFLASRTALSIASAVRHPCRDQHLHDLLVADDDGHAEREAATAAIRAPRDVRQWWPARTRYASRGARSRRPPPRPPLSTATRPHQSTAPLARASEMPSMFLR